MCYLFLLGGNLVQITFMVLVQHYFIKEVCGNFWTNVIL